MISIEQIKKYIQCPQFGDLNYGKWGALSLEQRKAFKRLIEIIEGQEEEIERLNNIMTELEIELYAKYQEHKDSECEELYAKAQEDKEILDYIKELKGSDKE